MEPGSLSRLDQRNLNAVDLGKFLMAFFVVGCHTDPFLHCTSRPVLIVYHILLSYAVPFFFLATGYLLGRKLCAMPVYGDTAPLDGYIKKTFRMYIICSLLYLPLAISFFIQSDYPLWEMFTEYIKGLVFWGEHYNSWQLWYLLSSVYALLCIRFLVKHKVSIEVLAVLALLVIPLMVCVDALATYEYGLPSYAEAARSLLLQTFRNSRILNGFVMIPLGIFLAKHSVSGWMSAVLFVAGIVLIFVPSSLIGLFGTFCSAVGLFGIALNISLPNSPVYKVLRAVSTDIFVIHMWIWTIYYTLVYQEKTYGMDSFLVTLAGSIVYSLIKQKVKASRKKVSSAPAGIKS